MSNEMPEYIAGKGINVNRTYSFINNVGFYALANPNYYDYYQMVVRQIAGWLDGYVYDFHGAEEGIFSTRLATALVKGITNQIIGNEIMFKQGDAGNPDGLNFINKWQGEARFQESVRKAVGYAMGLGTSALKINANYNHWWLEAKRLDQFFFEVDFQGRCIDYRGLIKNYSQTKAATNGATQENFYLVEHRYFTKERKREYVKGEVGYTWRWKEQYAPYIEYVCHKLKGQSRFNQDNNFSDEGDIRFDSLPSKMRDAIIREFGIKEFGKPYKLPFSEHLGVVLLKNDGGDITLPNIPFGTSMLQDIISYLMAYDLEWSYYVRDMYLGKGMIMLPRFMEFNKKDNSVLNSLDKSVYTFVPSSDPDKIKPEKIQFDLRVEEHRNSQNNILEKIATHIGMSPKTIASYLEDGGTKTATEIDAEDDATINFIDIKRKIFETPINELLEVVLNSNKLPNDIKIRFSTPSIVNKDKVLQRVVTEYQSGFITLKEAIRQLNPDDSEEQINKKLQEVQAEAKTRQINEVVALGDAYGV